MYVHPRTIPFWLIHAIAVGGVVALGWSWAGLAIAIFGQYVRMFFVTAGYHRYFSHRTFKTSRVMQFVFAFCAQITCQKGVLWWAANHRHHHRYSDQEQDLHSPIRSGFWWSHVGWMVATDYNDTRFELIKDMAKYPELRVLNRFWWLPPLMFGTACFLVGGLYGLTWAFFVPTVINWHGTFTINSLSHVFGSRPYPTTDTSRNNFVLALITMGEGWHNNHHHFQGSVNQGWHWYQIDMTYYILRVMSWFRLVWDLKMAPAHIIEGRTQRPALLAVKPEAELKQAA